MYFLTLYLYSSATLQSAFWSLCFSFLITVATFTFNFNVFIPTWSEFEYLRHWDDHEVQPVPRVSEEGEVIYSKAPGDNFCEWLKRIDTREGVPWRKEQKKLARWPKITISKDLRPAGLCKTQTFRSCSHYMVVFLGADNEMSGVERPKHNKGFAFLLPKHCHVNGPLELSNWLQLTGWIEFIDYITMCNLQYGWDFKHELIKIKIQLACRISNIQIALEY